MRPATSHGFWCITLVLAFCLQLIPTASAQNFVIDHPTYNAGGTSGNERFSVTGTIGQPAAQLSRGGNFEVKSGLWSLLNQPALIAAQLPQVTVDEGATAANHGTFSDPDGNNTVTITASLGVITRDDLAGTWSWSFATTDGPDQSQTVTITIDDDVAPPVTTSFSLTVRNVAPAAEDQNVPAAEDAATSITLAAADPGTDTLTCLVTANPLHGTLTGTLPNLTYTPAPNYHGPDSFQFKATDSDDAESAIATVNITVVARNDVPVLDALAAQGGAYGSALSISIGAHDVDRLDASPDTLTLTVSGLPAGLSFSQNPAEPGSFRVTGRISGTPTTARDFNVSVKATDASGAQAEGGFPLSIARAYLSATAHDAARDYGQGNPPLTGVLTGVVNNDNITASFTTEANAASPVGAYPIVPVLSDSGNKLGNYHVTRNHGTLTVRNVPPIVNAGSDQEKVALDEVKFSGSINDPSSATHTIEWDFGDGSAKVSGTLTPAHVYLHHGVYTVTLTVQDNQGARASDTLTVTVLSAFGCASEALDKLLPYMGESKRIERAVKDVRELLKPEYWLDEMHVQTKHGAQVFTKLRQAIEMLDSLATESKTKAESANQGEDDDEFKRLLVTPIVV